VTSKGLRPLSRHTLYGGVIPNCPFCRLYFVVQCWKIGNLNVARVIQHKKMVKRTIILDCCYLDVWGNGE